MTVVPGLVAPSTLPRSVTSLTGVPCTLVMVSFAASLPCDGESPATWVTTILVSSRYASAASSAEFCEVTKSWVFFASVCCWVWPGGKISSRGTTARSGSSQPRMAASRSSRSRTETVVRLRLPVVFSGSRLVSWMIGCPDWSTPRVSRVGPGPSSAYGTGSWEPPTSSATSNTAPVISVRPAGSWREA